jgi:hypothetical protein
MPAVARLALFHVLANALLLWLGYYWLGLGEGHMPALIWSLFVALALVGCTGWIYGAAFAFFSEAKTERQVLPAYRIALRHLAPLTLALLVTLALYYGLARWAAYSPDPAATFASYLTLKLRKPVKPQSVLRAFNVALWIVRWVIVPVLLIPLMANIASLGWAGLRARKWRWIYWVAMPAALLCAQWIPLHLLGWVPHVGSFPAELASFVVRAVLAYLLFIAGWLALAFVTSRGKPSLTQASTVASP